MQPQEICIIIPVYNAEKYINEAVLSIAAQPCSHLQIICVDDGSRDCSPQLLNQLAPDHKNLHVIHQTNQGVSAARNTGIEYALRHTNAAYFAFLDADDFYFPKFFSEELLALLESRQDIYAFSLLRCNAQADRCQFFGQTARPSIPGGEQAVWSIERFHANLYSRRLFEQCGIRFPVGVKYAEDQIFLKQCLALSGSIAFSPRIMYVYRTNSASAMARSRKISAIDYYTPIIAAWKNSDTLLNAATGGSFTYGSTLASLYMLDMAKGHFQQFGSAGKLSDTLQTNPHFGQFCAVTAREFAPADYAQYLQYRHHPLLFQIKNMCRGLLGLALHTAARLPWCLRRYEKRKFPLLLADVEQRSEHA